MTSEEDFQNAIDADPTDYHLRLVFADWLEERGDPRADGYRALAMHQKWPKAYDQEGNLPVNSPPTVWRWWDDLGGTDKEYSDLFRDWYKLLKGTAKEVSYSQGYDSRRAAEDAAALAFLELPSKRRAELLNRPVLDHPPD